MGSYTFNLDNSLNIKSVKGFYEKLKELIEKHDEIILDFKSVESVDLSVLQVLFAAGRTMKQNGKNIKYKSLTEGIKRQFYIFGLIKSL